MRVATGSSTKKEARAAFCEAWDELISGLGGERPKLVMCSASVCFDADNLLIQLKQVVPSECKIAAASSCLGVMSQTGFHSEDGYGLGLFALTGEGDYGVGLVSQGGEPKAAAHKATLEAITNAGRPGELPEVLWLTAAPGQEEHVIEGVAAAVGPDVPIIGGSAGDNDIAGDWWLFTRDNIDSQGVMVVAMYPETEIGLSFHCGYAPTQQTGVVTSASGRTLHTIDGKPAAEIYNQWTHGLVELFIKGGNVLAVSTLQPLGKEAGRVESIPYYALMHPEQILADGSMTLFSDVKEGEEVTLMEGSPESLTRRAGVGLRGVLSINDWVADDVAGALVVYCAGCMLSVQGQMGEVVKGLNESMKGAPFHGVFTFGEQGCFVDGKNRHANLMISLLVFKRT